MLWEQHGELPGGNSHAVNLETWFSACRFCNNALSVGTEEYTTLTAAPPGYWQCGTTSPDVNEPHLSRYNVPVYSNNHSNYFRKKRDSFNCFHYFSKSLVHSECWKASLNFLIFSIFCLKVAHISVCYYGRYQTHQDKAAKQCSLSSNICLGCFHWIFDLIFPMFGLSQ